MKGPPAVGKVALRNGVAAALLAALCLTACGPAEEKPAEVSETAVAPGVTNVTPTATRPEFQKLLGKWERPDGGYVLELRTVDASGKMEAGYFNPSPIHVSRALAIQEGATTKVFIELQDVNYPGCTYSMTYDPKTDQLYGQYFQAAVQQTYDVAFARLQ